jgi:hypothetical protein
MFYKSCALILMSKGLAIASPLCLKFVIDGMTAAEGMNLHYTLYGIGAFGSARFLSIYMQEYRMKQIAEIIQKGLRKVSFQSFTHMHSLDLNFHKTSSKNTVFAINRATKSLESGLRFSLGFFVPIAAEFILLCGMLGGYCGPKYLGNMLMTLGCYTYYTRIVSKQRRVEIRDRKEAEKK